MLIPKRIAMMYSRPSRSLVAVSVVMVRIQHASPFESAVTGD